MIILYVPRHYLSFLLVSMWEFLKNKTPPDEFLIQGHRINLIYFFQLKDF
jgi:hypothetical protein